MEVLRWLFTLSMSFLVGVLLLRMATVHPLVLDRYAFAAGFSVCLWVAMLVAGFSGVQLLLALALSLGCALAGYALATRAVLSTEDPRPVPKLTRSKNDPGLGHTAVVYFTHGEPETCNPIGWINQFREFDEQGIQFVPFLIRPLFLYQLRKKYLQVGRSEHRQMHSRMMKSLEQAFRAHGDTTTRFYLSFLDDDPRPDAAVITALNEGASRIIVCLVFVTVSNHTAEGKALVDQLHVEEEFGVPVQYTDPLWDSSTLHRMFVRRANEYLGPHAKSEVGVLLVGHGQPDEWDQAWPTETEQEIQFREAILELLRQDGYHAENLSLAWMEFREPKPANKVEEFVRNGVKKVLYFPAAISADAIHSQCDIPALVSQAQVPDSVPLVNMRAWNDDPLAISAIKERIDVLIRAPEGG